MEPVQFDTNRSCTVLELICHNMHEQGAESPQLHMKNKFDLPLDRPSLLAALDHSLRSPLNSIFHHSELLLMGLEGDISEAVRADVQTIADEAQALNSVLQRLLLWVQLEASGPARSRVNIARLTRTAIREAQSAIDRAGKQLVSNIVDQVILVLADEKVLYQIVLSLLLHSAEDRESPHIAVTLQSENDSVLLIIGNGPMTAANTPKAKLGGGTIADLLLSSVLVEQMGGQLTISQSSASNQAIGLHFPRITEAVDSIP